MASCTTDPVPAINLAKAEYAASSPYFRIFTYPRFLFKAGLAILRSDARYSLMVVMMTAVMYIGILSVILHENMVSTESYEYDGDTTITLYGTDEYSTLFANAIKFSLIVSLPTVIDFAMSFTLLRQYSTEWRNPRECSLLYVLLVLIVPNFFIYLQIIPVIVIDFIMFCQFICIFYALNYRIYSLASTMKVIPTCPLREVMFLAVLTMTASFFYKLCIHHFDVSGWIVHLMKGLFTSFLVGLQGLTCFKLRPWFNITWQISRVVKNHTLLQNKLSFYVVMLGIIGCCALTVIHLATYQLQYVYFPKSRRCYFGLQWTFCGLLLAWSATRNFEVKKSNLALEEQLTYNRKMTRSISHEIRTPLNTAFMALELLITNIAQQEAAVGMKSPLRLSDKMEPQQVEKMMAGSIFSSKKVFNNEGNSLLEIAESVKEGCDVALNILNQLLTFEKLSAGMLQLESKVISLNQLLTSNMKLFKMQAQQSGITFRLDPTNINADYLHVFVDEHKMNQVLRNLLSNAMKFTPRNGVVEVRLQWIPTEERDMAIRQLLRQETISPSKISTPQRLKPGSNTSLETNEDDDDSVEGFSIMKRWCKLYRHMAKGQSSSIKKKVKTVNVDSNIPIHLRIVGAKACGTILISIVDSGPGVSKEDQKKLFQEYVQINPGELQKGQGTGLGLSISKSIVHLHGGNIGMTSEGRGKGSTFFVELPSYRLIAAEENAVRMRLYDTAVEVLDQSMISAATSMFLKSPSTKNAQESRSGSHHKVSSGSRSSNANKNRHQVELAPEAKSAGAPNTAPIERVESMFSVYSQDNKSADNSKLGISIFASTNVAVQGSSKRGLSVAAGENGNIVGSDYTDYQEGDDIEEGIAKDPVSHHANGIPTKSLTDFCRSLFSPFTSTFDNNHTSANYQRVAPAYSTSARSSCAPSSARSLPPLEHLSRKNHATIAVTTGNAVGDDGILQPFTHSKSDDKTERESQLAAVAPEPQPEPQPHTYVLRATKRANRMSFVVPPRSYRIMVVDDAAPNRKMLSRLLTREHHVVIEASDGKEAVDMMQELIRDRENTRALIDIYRQSRQMCAARIAAKENSTIKKSNTNSDSVVANAGDHGSISTEKTIEEEDISEKIHIPPMFDLILMDYYMPNMTGPEAIAEIRKLGYKGMIVGVSGVMDDDVNHFVQAGANLVLCKPLTLTALWKALRGTTFFADTAVPDDLHHQHHHFSHPVSQATTLFDPSSLV